MFISKKKIFATFIVLILLSFIVIFNQINDFSPAKWGADHGNRVLIVDDLLAKYNLKGMSKAEIIELLGEENGPFFMTDDNIFAYYLGYENVFSIISNHSKWLKVEFYNDKVISFEVFKY